MMNSAVLKGPLFGGASSEALNFWRGNLNVNRRVPVTKEQEGEP